MRKGLAPIERQPLDFIGADERNRTVDLRITNALLYQLSYTGVEAETPRVAAIIASGHVLPEPFPERFPALAGTR